MTRVVNDLLLTRDSNASSLLVLIDLSAAFDTIDHSILLDCLGTALHWFRSYLTDRTDFVVWEVSKSKHYNLSLVFPRGRSLVHCSLQCTCSLSAILFTALEFAFTAMPTTHKSTFLLDQRLYGENWVIIIGPKQSRENVLEGSTIDQNPCIKNILLNLCSVLLISM